MRQMSERNDDSMRRIAAKITDERKRNSVTITTMSIVPKKDKMRKRQKNKCILNTNLRQKYPFLETTISESHILCRKCLRNFSLASGGNADIVRHLKSKKHRAAESSNRTVNVKSYFKSELDTPEGEEIHSFPKESPSDNESDNDYIGDTTHDETYDDVNELIKPPPKYRKNTDSTDVNVSAANSSTDKCEDVKNRRTMNADEKWWQAQYGFYMKLNKKQQFKMRKIISELQLKFEYENLKNVENGIIAKFESNNVADVDDDDDDDDDDDPLEVSSPWW